LGLISPYFSCRGFNLGGFFFFLGCGGGAYDLLLQGLII